MAAHHIYNKDSHSARTRWTRIIRRCTLGTASIHRTPSDRVIHSYNNDLRIYLGKSRLCHSRDLPGYSCGRDVCCQYIRSDCSSPDSKCSQIIIMVSCSFITLPNHHTHPATILDGWVVRATSERTKKRRLKHLYGSHRNWKLVRTTASGRGVGVYRTGAESCQQWQQDCNSGLWLQWALLQTT